LTLWQLPYISVKSRLYAEGVEKGYFAINADNLPSLIDGFFGKAAVIDFSNPAAADWYTSKMKPLFDIGVAAIKTDFGEGAPIEANYHAGNGLMMHNLYPLLYNKAVFDYSHSQTGDNLIWGRSAYAGSQRFPVYWGGDPAARWGDLANLLNGGLGLGMCGFPFWSQDIGGFAGTPTPELYIRWAEMGLFMTHPRAHGPIAREPWAFGEQALTIFRTYADLRYRLLPYIYSEAVRCVAQSQPVMRPMVFDWQDDPSTYCISDQFMFGEALLVAPIVDESNQRKIYFPEGRWFNFWSEELRNGPRSVNCSAELEELPLFVKEGAIIPLAASSIQHTGTLNWDNLTLDIYPSGESSFQISPPDRATMDISCTEKEQEIYLHLTPSPTRYTIILHLSGQKASQIWANGQVIYGQMNGNALTFSIPAEMNTIIISLN